MGMTRSKITFFNLQNLPDSSHSNSFNKSIDSSQLQSFFLKKHDDSIPKVFCVRSTLLCLSAPCCRFRNDRGSRSHKKTWCTGHLRGLAKRQSNRESLDSPQG